MSLNSIFQFLVPKDKKFFPLFEQASTNLISLAETLHEAVNAPKTEREDYFKKIEELEAKGPRKTRGKHIPKITVNSIDPRTRLTEKRL